MGRMPNSLKLTIDRKYHGISLDLSLSGYLARSGHTGSF